MLRSLGFVTLLSFAALLSGRPASLHAQQQIQFLEGPSAFSLFGDAAADIGDLDGDAIPEYIVSAPKLTAPGDATVTVYSGACGTAIHTIPSPDGQPYFGESVAGLGDLDGDGVPDYAVGYPDRDFGGQQGIGTVYLYSGLTGDLLATLDGTTAWERYGDSIASIPDLDQDGVDDFLVSAPGLNTPSANGRVEVRSGRTRQLLFEVFGAPNGHAFGESLAFAGDVNADGVADFVVGSPGVGFTPGEVLVISGANGGLLHQVDGWGLGPTLGLDVAGGRDVDGDGWPDFGAAAFGEWDPGSSTSGAVYVWSGRTGQILYRFAESSGLLASQVAFPGDVDGDGIQEILVSGKASSPGNPGKVNLYSGQDGSLKLAMTTAVDPWTVLEGIGDLTGDGLPEILVGDSLDDSNGQESGALAIYSFDPSPGGTPYSLKVSFKVVLGNGCAGNPFWTTSTIQSWLQEANDVFTRDLGVGLVLDEIVEIVDPMVPSSLFDPDTQDKDDLEVAMERDPARFAWRTDAINVYLTNSLTSGGSTIGGVCSFPESQPDDDLILVQPAISNDGLGLAHEIGHYLNLYHTHATEGEGAEDPADCSTQISANGAEAGDLVCDTPGDPGDEALLDAWYGASSCFGPPPTVGTTNPEHPYNLLRYNVMSYYNPIQPTEGLFTAGQRQRVLAAIQGWRASVEDNAVTPRILSVSPDSRVYPGPMSLTLSGTDFPQVDEAALSVRLGGVEDEELAPASVSLLTPTSLVATFADPLPPGRHTVCLYQDDELIAWLEDAVDILPMLTWQYLTSTCEIEFTAQTAAPNATIWVIRGMPESNPFPGPTFGYMRLVDPAGSPLSLQTDASGIYQDTLEMSRWPSGQGVQFLEQTAAAGIWSNAVFLTTP